MLTIILLLVLLAPWRILTLRESSWNTSLAPQLIFQFPNQSLENLAVRSNGHLILTFNSGPLLYDLDPTSSNPSPKLLHQFADAICTLGIAETAPDIFAVVVGNVSITTLVSVPGSFSVWSIDLNMPKPTVRLIASIPAAAGLNGMTTVKGIPNTVLIADSVLGAVWRLNVITGYYSIAIQNPLFLNSSINPLGINGIHSHEGMLYFTNTAQRSYGRVSIADDGSATGEVEILATAPSFIFDDFALDREASAWITAHPNAVIEVTTKGIQRNATADSSIEFLQPTAARFGRGHKHKENTLYVVTVGSATGGGQVIAINTHLI